MRSRSIVVYSARPVGDQDVPRLCITAKSPVPDLARGGSLEEHCRALDADAENIVNAMLECLPQGVVGRIFARLAQKYATDFAVAWNSVERNGEKV